MTTTTAQGEPGAGTCKHCHHPMRYLGTPAREYPGTRMRQRTNECRTCIQRLTRAGEIKPAPKPAPAPVGDPEPATLTAYRLFLEGRRRRGARTEGNHAQKATQA